MPRAGCAGRRVRRSKQWGTRAHTTMHVGGGLSSISDAGLVLALKDGDDNVFGAFVNEKLRPQQHYYGSGECFLWKTTRSAWAVARASLGCGWMARWRRASVRAVRAFDNEVLCDAMPRGKGQREGEKRFECYGLEVWAVGID
ncbi:hypothetical protein L1887_58688 [Cichorium endivia]|nr:hypothetical protein L1887_58688 [Cichorium endivia]